MKVLFVGLGSIGNRHLKNLASILTERESDFTFDALRSSKRELVSDVASLITNSYFNIELLPADYDVAFITNPTVSHFEIIKKIAQISKHIFIEKPLFEKTSYIIEDLGLKNGVYYVACPMRYTGVFDKLKDFVANNKIFSVRAICSTYLPDWRPGQDYSKVYSARKELGGGVTIDLIHEWDYLSALFGFPKKVISFNGTYSDLDITSDDLYTSIAKYDDKIVELHLDYFGRIPIRKVELFTAADTVTFDFQNSQIITEKGKRIEIIDESSNDRYIKEIQTFLDILDKKKNNPNTVEHAFAVQKMIEDTIME